MPSSPLQRLDRLQIMRERRVDAGVDHRRVMPLSDGGEAFGERPRLVVLVPVERVGDDKPGEACSPSAWTRVQERAARPCSCPPPDQAEFSPCLIEFACFRRRHWQGENLAFDACACSRNE